MIALFFYNNLIEAEKEADLLYDRLSKNNRKNKHQEAELKVLLQKSYIHTRNNERKKALEISLGIIDNAKKYSLPEKEYQAYLMAAVIYEHLGELDICKKYLDKALQLYKKNDLDSLYSKYCIRLSSYYRYVKEKDSAIYYARQGMDYAERHGNEKEYLDGALLLGILLEDVEESVKYFSLAAKAFYDKSDYESATAMYNNIARTYFYHNETDKAFQYNDSSLRVFKTNDLPETDYFFRVRYQLFEVVGNTDSAYYYFQKYHETYVEALSRMEAAEMKKIAEQYDHDKREAIIKTRNRQMIFTIGLLVVVVMTTLLIIRKNRQINIQNKIISRQLAELSKTVEQKQVLLSELQHRVKNSLQYVISILEIQKESVDFNNIDELIRGNQNRIHSMALLHKKLNTFESVNEVDLKRYVLELTELVKDSYDNHKKKISLNITCGIETISIEKALPLGLIIVELLSNSMKHAFKKRNIGIINIEITKEKDANKFYYADNGSGYDFDKTTKKGLGQEIIKGLIDQLDGTTKTQNNNGFELTVYFK